MSALEWDEALCAIPGWSSVFQRGIWCEQLPLARPCIPCLHHVESICRTPESDLWHTLIEAGNYHALCLLQYLCSGKVDCIYIDPPYNGKTA